MTHHCRHRRLRVSAAECHELILLLEGPAAHPQGILVPQLGGGHAGHGYPRERCGRLGRLRTAGHAPTAMACPASRGRWWGSCATRARSARWRRRGAREVAPRRSRRKVLIDGRYGIDGCLGTSPGSSGGAPIKEWRVGRTLEKQKCINDEGGAVEREREQEAALKRSQHGCLR